MKTALDHLPEIKQFELRTATDIVVEMVAPALVILFGSYARGDWVEEMDDEDVYFRYQSDFDLLVVVRHESQAAKIQRSDSVHKRLNRPLKTPVSLIAEDIGFINRRLATSHYFYTDIKREGILLYSSGELELGEARELAPKERKNLAQDDFDDWIAKADALAKGYEFYLGQQLHNEAAFHLHQITERLYTAILLVFTRYKPRTHDLKELRQRVAGIEPATLVVFPQGTVQEQERFSLLCAAYVEARYTRSYAITAEELAWLAARVGQLRSLAESLCKAKIASFGG